MHPVAAPTEAAAEEEKEAEAAEAEAGARADCEGKAGDYTHPL